jgi:EpsI family protein
MHDRLIMMALGLLVTQGCLVRWLATGEHLPDPPSLSTFPDQIGHWKQFSEDPIEPAVQAELRADGLLSRTYLDPSTHTSAGLLVAWFQSQRGGHSQPHSPKVCLPGSGWTAEESSEITLDTTLGAITINRYAAVNRGQHSIVLYWYQTPRRVVANEWAAKFWLAPDAIRDRRTDTALVRVVLSASGAEDAVARGVANEFVRQVYPILRSSLPR